MRIILLATISLCLGAAGAFAQPAASAMTSANPVISPAHPDPDSIYGAATVGAFLAACRGDQGGCMDEVGTALMDKMDYSGTSRVCISSPDYGQPVPAWLSAHPQTANMPTEDGIYLAIETLYPCAGRASG